MKTLLVIVILLGGILLIAYWFRNNQPAATHQDQMVAKAGIGKRIKEDNCHVNGPFQDKECSPGAIFPDVTAKEICVRGYAKSVRNVPISEKHEVFSEYGITHHSPGEYEVDHIISLELGGSNDIANLFPEAAKPRPGFHEKDKVENYLHREVCSGRISLHDAQVKIANDWLSVYKRMGEE